MGTGSVALSGLAHGREAAEIMGLTRADHVWRAVKLHGAAYPGGLTVLQFGRMKAVRREELRDFATWYDVNVRAAHPRGAKSEPKATSPRPRVENAAGLTKEERRRALGAAIERISNGR